VRDETEVFRFTGIPSPPVPALLRGFSAPVRLDYPYTSDDLALLMAHETDPFCRWEAGQRLSQQLLLGLVADVQGGRELKLDPGYIAAFETLLTDRNSDRAFQAEALTLPTEAYLAELMPVVDPDAIFAARQFVRRTLAVCLQGEFLAMRSECRTGAPYRTDDGLAGQRRLANLCLAYLLSLDEQSILDMAMHQFRTADNMTDTMGALTPLVSCDCPERAVALEEFQEKWQDDRGVMDKWFTLQAVSSLPGTLGEVSRLLEHPAFELKNPNRFRSLVGAFSQANQVRFHAADGSGYRLVAEQLIRLIPLNPQVSARLLSPFTRWRRFDPGRQALMRVELERIHDLPDLPKDVYEVVEKSLA
jgi:aminopeptidase N